MIKRKIIICNHKICSEKGSAEVESVLSKCLREKDLLGSIEVEHGGCFHLHEYGPILIIQPDNIFYTYVNTENIIEIVEKNLINNEVIEKLLFHHPETGEIIQNYKVAQNIVKELKQQKSLK